MLFKTFIAKNYLAKLINWLEKKLDFLLAIFQKTEEEKVAEHKKILEYNFEIVKNEAFIDTITFLENLFLEKKNTNIGTNETDDWKDKP